MTKLKIYALGLFAIILATTVACGAIGSTGDQAGDEQSAQAFMPTFNGYGSTNAKNIKDALATIMQAGSAVTGNLPAAALINRLDAFISCYQEVGAIDARVYSTTSLNVIPPIVGALAIVNQNRVADNFAACALNPSGQGGLSGAQAAAQPCFGSGSFTRNDETFLFIYGASDQQLCDNFNTHFRQYQ